MRNNRFFAFLFSVLAVLLGFLPSSAFALDAANNGAVTSALTDGATSVGTVVVGVIAIGAVLTGLGLIYKWLAK